MILFAPRWPFQPWFTDLIELSRGPPLQLPLSRNLLVKLRSRIRCNSPESLNLHTWLLCGTDLPDIIMLSDLSRPLSLAKSRCPYMIPSWEFFLVLCFLHSSPYEPVASIFFKLLTRKAAFLLALVSGRHHRDLHTLNINSANLAFERDGSVTV